MKRCQSPRLRSGGANKRREMLMALVLIAACASAALAQAPLAADMLKRCIAVQHLPTQYYYHLQTQTTFVNLQSKEPQASAVSTSESSNVYRDGQRYDRASVIYRSRNATTQPVLVNRIVRDETKTLGRNQNLSSSGNIFVSTEKSSPIENVQRSTIVDAVLDGDTKPAAAVLLDAGTAMVKGEEAIDSHPCTIVEGKAPGGVYTLWLDKEQDFIVRKAKVDRKAGDVYRGPAIPPTQHIETSLEMTTIEKIGDLYIGMEARESIRFTDGTAAGGQDVSGTRSRVTFTPDFSKAFALQHIPNGTPVMDIANQNDESNVWQNGEIVKRPEAKPTVK